MDIDRRSLMKGLLAGGALLALGTPPWVFADSPTRKAKQCLLFLGHSAVDDAFAKGVSAVSAEMGYSGLQTVRVNGGLLSDPGLMVGLLEQSGGARWIAVMDDASAAVFQRLARAASEIQEPKYLEEQAIKLVGKDVYFKLIKANGFLFKKWQCTKDDKDRKRTKNTG